MAARDSLITSVIDLVRRRGVAGTGLNALLDDSGVSRRTIYLNFPGGKQELVAEATRVAGRAFTAALQAADSGDDPGQAVQTFIDRWKAQLLATQLRAGCPIVAAALGRNDAPEAAAAAGEAFGDWGEALAERLMRGGMDGRNARSMATMTIAAVEGAVVMAIATQSTAPLDDVACHLAELMNLHAAPRP